MNINLNGDSKYPINHKHFFKIMRTTLILLFCGIMFSQASNSYSQVFNFNLKSTFIKDVFNEIEENSDYIFVFTDKSEKIIDKKVDLNANSEDVKEILDNVLSTTGLTYRIIDRSEEHTSELQSRPHLVCRLLLEKKKKKKKKHK